jgi:hypothetical protein
MFIYLFVKLLGSYHNFNNINFAAIPLELHINFRAVYIFRALYSTGYFSTQK